MSASAIATAPATLGQPQPEGCPMAQYTASSLADIAAHFEDLAADQIGMKRFQTTTRNKRECEIRAEVWRDAASILRDTEIVPPTDGGNS